MSKLVLIQGALLITTLLVGVASAQELTLMSQPSPAWLRAAEPVTPPAPHLIPSPPKPEGVPPGPSAGTPRPPKSLNIDIKVDGNSIRVGGQVLGNKGVSAAWLGTKFAGNSYGVDGGFQGNGGPPHDFNVNLDLLPGWARTAARIWMLLP